MSVGFVKPLSFSCFSNTFRQPPDPTSSQLCGQADTAGPAESYRLYPGFPHGGRRRVTKALLKFGVQSLSCLLLPRCVHTNKHYSGHRTILRKISDISHALFCRPRWKHFWETFELTPLHFLMTQRCHGSTLPVFLSPEGPSHYSDAKSPPNSEFEMNVETLYLWSLDESLSYTKEKKPRLKTNAQFKSLPNLKKVHS